MKFEVCVDSVFSALAAQQGGADRVEVCANLVEGGTTPSIGLLRTLRKKLHIPMHAIIRPRGGDFLYSDVEFEVMREDVTALKAAGCDGVVFGILTEEGDIDSDRIGRIIESAGPMSVTFHRAFDMVRRPESALETLIDLGIDRVLTSGLKPDALDGAETIKALVIQAADRITIIAGAGINAGNLVKLIARTGVKEVHFSARMKVASLMKYRNDNVFMGKAYQPDEYHKKETDEELVREIIRSMDALRPKSFS
jgi:copper homeostasis protein